MPEPITDAPRLLICGENAELLRRLADILQQFGYAAEWAEWHYSGPGTCLPKALWRADRVVMLYTQETLLRSCKGGSMLRRLMNGHSQLNTRAVTAKMILMPETPPVQIPDAVLDAIPALKTLPQVPDASIEALAATLSERETGMQVREKPAPEPETVSVPQSGKKPVFISYSSKDREQVDALRDLLQQNGIRCWMAPYDIPPGARYLNVIADAIDGCGGLLVVVSVHAQASEQVEREVNLLISDFPEKPVFALIIDGHPLRGWMRLLLQNRQIEQTAQITAEEPGLSRLIAVLRQLQA
jgi:hypothetical protein